MLKADIEYMAFYNRELPDNAAASEKLYYHAIKDIYGELKAKQRTEENAKALKEDISACYDLLTSLAKSNTKIIIELAKLTAPRKDLTKKDKSELLEIIARMDGLLSGILPNAKAALPEFLKIEGDKP